MSTSLKEIAAKAFWNNTETWTTREGVTLRLDEMSTRHLENVAALLHRKGDDLAEHVRALRAVEMMFKSAELDLHTQDSDFIAEDPFDEEMDRLQAMTAAELIDGTPLMRRITELLAAGS